MSRKRERSDGQFVGDDHRSHALVPSEVIAAVPAARARAERSGREVRLDFLDDKAVLWMLDQRYVDSAQRQFIGFAIGGPLVLAAFALWPFWALVASQKSTQFQMVAGAAAALVLGTLLLLLCVKGGRATFDPGRRNVRTRAKVYREIVATARRNGADIPGDYPYYSYGIFAASRKFDPEAEDLAMPSGEEAT